MAVVLVVVAIMLVIAGVVWLLFQRKSPENAASHDPTAPDPLGGDERSPE